ncbi:MAG: type II toxin-antitoxin system RelE/ParE family toxin [Caulobacteraceae bacterium]
MTGKPVAPREQARRDVEEAIRYYATEASETIALGFVDALEAAYGLIANHPQSGSQRYAHELSLPDLRSRALQRYPYIVFYVEGPDAIDIWRVLQAQRDIPSMVG